MKTIIKLLIIIQFFGCYNNVIPSMPHINYKLNNREEANKNSSPKSIIFIIADGTGIGQYSLSYYANGPFAPARFEHIGLVATHPNHGDCESTCKRVTDSAASGTALSAGIKTYNSAIGVDRDTLAVKTMLEWAEEKNMSTGLVASSTVTHATPASFAAHVDSRSKQKEIALQFAESEVDVILGGGKMFWPDSLIVAYERRGGQYIDKIDAPLIPNKRLLGLFADKALPPAHEGRNPSTTEMARLALSKLDQNPNGYFVMIEESQVDWGGHSNSAEYIKGEMASLNELVDFALDYQIEHPDVLVLLTADHECGGVSVHDAKDSELDIKFTSNYHSANFVPVWATGPGSEVFDAFMDNTEIGKQLIKYVKKR